MMEPTDKDDDIDDIDDNIVNGEDNSFTTLNTRFDQGYVADSDNDDDDDIIPEAIPIELQSFPKVPDIPKQMSSNYIDNIINKACSQYAYSAITDDIDELLDVDECIVLETNDNDVSDSDLLTRFEMLKNSDADPPSYSNIEYTSPKPIAPTLESLDSLDSFNMKPVDFDNVQNNKDIQKHDENIDNRLVHLVLQYDDMLHSTQCTYNHYKWYDGNTTSWLTGQTFDDVNLLPTAFIDFVKDDIKLETQFTRNIKLKMPIVSSPMDTITEDKMAIQMALLGGIGIIHCNNTPEEQASMVHNTKRYTNGLVTDPIVFKMNDSIQHVIDTQKQMNYNFSGFPITYNADKHGPLFGLLTKRDIALAKHQALIDNKSLDNIYVKDFMRSRKDNLIVLQIKNNKQYDNKQYDIDKIKDIMIRNRISKLPIITENDNLVGVACRADIINMQSHPNASIHPSTKQLLVGAAISTGEGYRKRVDLLASAKVDVIVIDSSQGCSSFQLKCLLYIKELYPHIDVVCGNVATGFQTSLLAIAGADAIRVGMGAGSICTTQNVTGTGRGQLAAIYACTKAIDALAKEPESTTMSYGAIGHTTTAQVSNPLYCKPIPIIADGGIKTSGDITKAFAVGANTVMLGSLLAGTNETPGIIEERAGCKVKKYRGMGSLSAMQKRQSDRYISGNRIVAQGVSGEVLAKGSVQDQLEQLIDGVKAGLINIGVKSLNDIKKLNAESRIRWEQKSHSVLMEGNVHSIHHYQY